ncbi:YceI family protein [Aureivirga marina]|uniref:YceI family protein n=1 Tax=Aureivirga marina TaxID=1182451 RepID=UPI001E4F57BF|nr:YceI family protein [Aureivirga marina]
MSMFFLILKSYSQNKYLTKNGITEFKASVETFEPVEAVNNNTTVLFKSNTNEIAILLFLKSFHFEIALMEEHFNENYMDSDKFPKAKFSGKIINKKDKYFIKGNLNIKGISKEVITEIEFIKGNTIKIKGFFEVKPSDFNIKIPSIVRKKISEKIKINFNYELQSKT